VPLRKCEPMLSYCCAKWTSGWRPGKSLSLDEETAGCKARCALVTRIKTSQKKEGDGFQADAICEDGYTITFHFRCDVLPCPQQKDVSPRDTRCAWLVDQLPGCWYHLWMDNLYTSWKFGEMLAARQCLYGGTMRNEDWRGIHKAVIQKTVTKVAELEKAKGTLLASVRAQGMPKGCEVICTSFYDDAPFMMMSNIVDSVNVIEIHRKCYSTGAQKHFWVIVKRLSLADVMYKAVCAEEKEKPMTHLEFHVAVATAWCKTPKIVLEYEKPTPAEARAAAEAAEPATSQTGRKNDLKDAKHEAAKKSYAESPELHCVEIPTLTPKQAVSNERR